MLIFAPMDCISFVGNDEEEALRLTLSAPAENKEQDLYVSSGTPHAKG